MARVNVEQKALTDPRFYRLGLDLGAAPEHAHAVGLFTMVRVWNECIERGKYTLDGWVIDAIVGRPSASEKITGSDLAVSAGHGRFRIKGTKGRVEYLEVQRRNGKQYGHLGGEHGKKGGRPKKPPVGVSGNGGDGMANNPLPAPAPALKDKDKRQKTPLPPETGGEGLKPPAPLVVVPDPRPPAVRPRDPMFDAVAEVAGANPKAQGGRIAKLARLMASEGITPEEFRERLPAVVRQYAPYRSACDLATIEACWSWIRTPPLTNGPPAGKALFKTRGEAEVDFFVRTTAEALGGST